MSSWKEFQLLHILNDLSIKHLIKLNLYGNDVKLLKVKEGLYRLTCDMFEVWDFDYWYLNSENSKHFYSVLVIGKNTQSGIELLKQNFENWIFLILNSL